VTRSLSLVESNYEDPVCLIVDPILPDRRLFVHARHRCRVTSGIIALMHLDRATLEAGLPRVRESPRDRGRVEQIVRRPADGERELVSEAQLNTIEGLVGDNWSKRPEPLVDLQLTLMNARAAALVAGHPDRWQLAGDQLYVDLDLRGENVPPGTRLQVGSAVIEVTNEPHTGCGKFSARFGVEALKFVNTKLGRELNLRGINAKVIAGGVVRPRDQVVKLSVWESFEAPATILT
jgi:hypothetical protein